ncbi:HIT family hydrolase [Cephaloticoccus primus]|uniref:HIT family hydrolase n=2 Tax=Cephaloticoccus primus TaxID=1548207 RepID=A0A139SMU8_9BACT|nr:HIT family hydrolase [Cephaloticoccus primus]
MEQLHPYWRMEYIAAPRYPETDRPFSELPALGDDARALIVYRGRLSYLLMNRYPYNPGHLLAIPYREVTDIEELSVEERGDLGETLVYAKRLLTAALRPDGFNIGYNLGSAAGGSIAHLHAHIVPRWQGDSNFMPVLGGTRILPQSLEALWARLREVASTLGQTGSPGSGSSSSAPAARQQPSPPAQTASAVEKQTGPST